MASWSQWWKTSSLSVNLSERDVASVSVSLSKDSVTFELFRFSKGVWLLCWSVPETGCGFCVGQSQWRSVTSLLVILYKGGVASIVVSLSTGDVASVLVSLNKGGVTNVLFSISKGCMTFFQSVSQKATVSSSEGGMMYHKFANLHFATCSFVVNLILRCALFFLLF